MYKEILFNELDSTQKYLLDNSQGVDDLTFVRCISQTNGHGRHQRNWISSSGSLTFSFILKDKYLLDRFDSLSLLIGVSIFKALKAIGVDSKIKWPNDVYVNDKKICGIILESVSYSELESIVIGVGINVNNNSPISVNGISLKEILKKEIDLDYFKDLVYKNILESFELFKENDSFYIDLINENNYLYDKEVQIYPYFEPLKGISKCVNKDNSLKVICDGKEYNIKSDEIFVLK